MFKSKEAHLVVLHDLAPARNAIKQALSEAEPAMVPGLRLALDILDASAPTERELTTEWTRQVLRDAEVDPRTEDVRAVRTLRQTLPGLGLSAAVELVAQASRHW